MSDEIQPVEFYRGVGIDDCQGDDRIAGIVKPAIDQVFAMTHLGDLLLYCGDISKPPEARRFAAAKLEASRDVSAAGRVRRPNVDIELVHATVAGLGSRTWRCPDHFCSLMDMRKDGSPDRRPPEFVRQVEEDKRRLDAERQTAPAAK